jgi:prevent-host-death family protein
VGRVYSTYEAKAKFSEIIRRVREGQRVVIAYRGQEVAEITPIETGKSGFADRLKRLEAEGAVSSAPKLVGSLKPVGKRRGALKRFLESRD